MAIPLALLIGAALAATAGGTALQYAGQQRGLNAIDAAQRAESQRQRGYEAEIAEVNNRSRKQFDDTQGQVDQRGGEINDKFQTAIKSQVGSYLPGSNTRGTPDIVRNAFDRNATEREAELRSRAEAFSRVNALGDLLASKNAALNQGGQDAAMLNQFRLGSLNIAPSEAMAAGMQGQGMRTLGDLLAGVGRAGTMASLTA